MSNAYFTRPEPSDSRGVQHVRLFRSLATLDGEPFAQYIDTYRSESEARIAASGFDLYGHPDEPAFFRP